MAYFRWRPEDATAFGYPGVDHSAVDDRSDAFLEDGAVPLPVMRDKLARWTAARATQRAR
jgi:hypothetical protein